MIDWWERSFRRRLSVRRLIRFDIIHHTCIQLHVQAMTVVGAKHLSLSSYIRIRMLLVHYLDYCRHFEVEAMATMDIDRALFVAILLSGHHL
jgi:hypothetical protein